MDAMSVMGIFAVIDDLAGRQDLEI